MKAVAYIRVSTLGQKEDGVSLEMQRARIVAWCVGNGYELHAVFAETMSGAKATNRRELQKALALACRLRANLVVYSLSRLARSVRDTLEIAERLEKANANLASLSERIDTNSAVGKLVFRLLSTLNEFERDQLAERTTSAMSHLRRAGRRISISIPFGHDLAADGATLTANTDEQSIIAEMARWRGQGMTLAEIACRLTVMGVRGKNGGGWYPSTVRSILARQLKLAA